MRWQLQDKEEGRKREKSEHRMKEGVRRKVEMKWEEGGGDEDETKERGEEDE